MIGALAAVSAVAQEIPKEVTLVPTFFAQNISPNGQFIGPYKGYAAVKDLVNGEEYTYSSLTFGLGNCLANNGMAVGDGVVMYKGGIVIPELLAGYRETEISCITPDATTVAGYVRNKDTSSPVSYIPYVAKLDETGEFTTMEMLPIPELDLMETPPQMVSALCISDDGLTIAGQVWDGYGTFAYPIVWKVNSELKWDYTLPSAGTFNPEGIEILQNPYDHAPAYPRAENFIENLVKRQAYLTAKEQEAAGGPAVYPEDYMTPEEYQNYENAVNEYNEWQAVASEELQKYLDNYNLILESSPVFEFNLLVLDPNGEYVYQYGGPVDKVGVQQTSIYEFTTTELSRVISAPDKNVAPKQMLSDGTLLASPSLMNSPSGYILLPGSEEFLTLPEYLATEHPELAFWVEESFPGGTGMVLMSDDKSVISGAFTVTQLSADLYDTADYNFGTYIINLNEAGVESIEAEGITEETKIYNLQGIRLDKPAKGINIINGKKVVVK